MAKRYVHTTSFAHQQMVDSICCMCFFLFFIAPNSEPHLAQDPFTNWQQMHTHIYLSIRKMLYGIKATFSHMVVWELFWIKDSMTETQGTHYSKGEKWCLLMTDSFWSSCRHNTDMCLEPPNKIQSSCVFPFSCHIHQNMATSITIISL